MRHQDDTRIRRLWIALLSSTLSLLGLSALGLPESRAQLTYSGGFIQKHRYPPEFPSSQPPAPKVPEPKTLASYFPDNDFTYPSYTARTERARAVPPSPDLLPYNLSASDRPWNRPDFEGYNESPGIPRDSSVLEPKKFTLRATPLLGIAEAERYETTVLIAHLPEHAFFWVDGARTRSIGQTRYFQSPPLLPNRKYTYRVRTAWIEDGHWVSQTRVVPVQAGTTQAIYLEPASPLPVKSPMK